MFEASGCTFKPQLMKPAPPRHEVPEMDTQKKGLDRYLERMGKAKNMRDEKSKIEE